MLSQQIWTLVIADFFLCQMADHALAGRPVSCKPLDSFFTPSDWTQHDCTACLPRPSENGK